jgi:hypothetical protein
MQPRAKRCASVAGWRRADQLPVLAGRRRGAAAGSHHRRRPGLHENIRVPGSHIGLGFNGIVLAIVADRLAQPEGDWHPFQPQGLLERTWRLTVGAPRRSEPSHAT